jgi:hypothetical protein
MILAVATSTQPGINIAILILGGSIENQSLNGRGVSVLNVK